MTTLQTLVGEKFWTAITRKAEIVLKRPPSYTSEVFGPFGRSLALVSKTSAGVAAEPGHVFIHPRIIPKTNTDPSTLKHIFESEHPTDEQLNSYRKYLLGKDSGIFYEGYHDPVNHPKGYVIEDEDSIPKAFSDGLYVDVKSGEVKPAPQVSKYHNMKLPRTEDEMRAESIRLFELAMHKYDDV